MPIPDYQTLMLPVLKAASHGEVGLAETVEKIANDFKLTIEERAELLPSGKQRLFYTRIRWAKLYLTRAGLLDSPSRGRFVTSPAGHALLAKSPTAINLDILKQYPAFVAFYGGNTASVQSVEAPAVVAAAAATTTPEEQIDAAYAVLYNALRADLLKRILDNDPSFFERAIIDLLVAMGYGGTHENAAVQLGKAGDNGVDGVIDEDRLGLDRIYVQAKRYAPHVSVGRPDIQAFVGSLVGMSATKGVFVTTSNFSSPAREFVQHLPQRVVLIDGDRLTELMVEHNVGVRIDRSIVLKRVDEDFFLDD